jgi:hypothetical protein
MAGHSLEADELILHRYDLGLALDELVRETRLAVDGWDWSRGAYGHALSLAAYADLHPYRRYSYQNFPCTGLLGRYPLFREIFEGLRCEKISFRLLRRGPCSSYAWHTDHWKGPGVVRFQIPILSDDQAFVVMTDYESEAEVRGLGGRSLTEDTFARFAAANAGHFRSHHLEPGWLYYFDTTRIHTLVNPGPGQRIALSFDLVANDWLRRRFPEIRAELGDEPTAPLLCLGRIRRGLALAHLPFYPLRNRARRWRAEHFHARES